MAQTSGVVQRLKWSSSYVFIYLGPTSSAVQLFVLRFDPIDAVALAGRRAISVALARAMSAGLAVTLTHGLGDSRVDGVDLRYAAVRVDGIEVTQSIQNLMHAVPLIALKQTIVRVYLGSRLPTVTTVSGRLSVRRPGGATQIVASLNSVALDPADFGQLNTLRADAAKSLNFRLTTVQTAAGTLEIALESLTDVGTGLGVGFGPAGTIDAFTFVAAAPLRIGVVGFSYQFGTPAQTFTPTVTDFGLLISWLRRAYPVAQVIASQQVVTATAAPAFSCGDINAEVAAIRALDVGAGVDARTHYYGLVSDGGFFMRGCAAIPGAPDPAAIGSGPTGPGSWGWDNDGSYGDWYGGHELGHTYSRLHPGFCGESNDDASYPFAAGQLADADGSFAGFDVGDAMWGLPVTALPGTVWHDVMTYCNRQWLSSYTYAGIKARLAAENALAPGPGPGRPDERYPDGHRGLRPGERPPQPPRPRTLVSLVARINLTQGTGRIAFVNPVARGEVAEVDPTGTVRIRTIGADEKALDEYSVGLKRLSDIPLGEDEEALCDVILPIDPDTAAMQLIVKDRVVDTRRLGAAVPSITEVRVAGFGPAGVDLTWGPVRDRATEHLYNVQVSHDRGRTWRTVALGVRENRVTVHPDNLPADRPVLFRILASDGVRSAAATIEWSLPRERPER